MNSRKIVTGIYILCVLGFILIVGFSKKEVICWRSKITGVTGHGFVLPSDAEEVCRYENRQHHELVHWVGTVRRFDLVCPK